MSAMKATFFFFILAILGGGSLQAQSVRPVPYHPMLDWDTSPYKSYRFTRPDKEWINFRLLFPNGYDSAANKEVKYPLVLVLHGAGESGRMEWNNTTKLNKAYPEGDARIDNNDHHLFFGGRQHLNAVKNGQLDAFVLFPQNFYGSWIRGNGDAGSGLHRELARALELVEYLVQNLKIDPDRIVIEGLSNGAAGAWNAVYNRPDLFAGLIPMSAHGDPEMASAIAPVPIWVFQGGTDTNPSPHITEKTVNAVKNAGGKIKYTLYPETGHNTWNKAFQEPEFFKWILARNRNEQVLNKLPAVSAGPNQMVLLPRDTTVLEGTATDEDGNIISYLWEKVSGPEAIIHQQDSPRTKISGLAEGKYVFRLTAMDNYRAKGSAEVTVFVSDKPLATPRESREHEITAYPNPFSDYLNLHIPLQKPEQLLVSLHNLQGKIFYQVLIPANSSAELFHTLQLNRLNLPPGPYLIQIRSKGKNLVRKLTVLKK